MTARTGVAPADMLTNAIARLQADLPAAIARNDTVSLLCGIAIGFAASLPVWAGLFMVLGACGIDP